MGQHALQPAVTLVQYVHFSVYQVVSVLKELYYEERRINELPKTNAVANTNQNLTCEIEGLHLMWDSMPSNLQ